MSVGQAPLGSKSSLELGTKMGLVFQWSLCGVWRLLCRTVEELRGCILGKSTTRKANHLTAVAESRDNHTGLSMLDSSHNADTSTTQSVFGEEWIDQAESRVD